MTNSSQIISTLKRDGFSLEQGAQYCRRIANTASHGGPDCQNDAVAYTLAADSLEAQANAEKLALDNVDRLIEENRHLASRVFELEKTITELIWGANI